MVQSHPKKSANVVRLYTTEQLTLGMDQSLESLSTLQASARKYYNAQPFDKCYYNTQQFEPEITSVQVCWLLRSVGDIRKNNWAVWKKLVFERNENGYRIK